MDIAAWIESFFKDLSYGLRQFRRNPVFTAIAVLSLAVGIGANTAIFSVINAVLLQSLPVRNPQQLVMLTDPSAYGISIGAVQQRGALTYQEYVTLRDHATSISGLSAAESELNNWDVRINGGTPEQAHGKMVSENYFSVFGVAPTIGRSFTTEDAKGVGTDPYAVVSYDYWRRRFAGKTSVLGTTIHIARADLTIVGVAPPGFRGETVGENPDFWVAMMMQPLVTPGRDWLHEDMSKTQVKTMWLHVFGRLNPGVSRSQAQNELSVLFHAALEAGYPTTLAPEARKNFLDQHITVRDASTGAFGGRNEFSRQLLLLLAASGVVLLIACANVANLLLARAAARYKEVGVRLSIGASRSRLLRQFLTESLLLSSLGGAAGLLIALGATRVLVQVLSGPQSSLQLSTGLDLRVLAFTAAASLFTGLLFGLAPAIRGTRVDINQSLRDSGTATSTNRGLTFAKLLVIAQVGLSLLMTVSAGLFLRTLWNLQAVDLGYPSENLLLVNIDALTAGYKDARLPALYRDLADRVRALPGVQSASYSALGLFSGGDLGLEVAVEGFTPQNDDQRGSSLDVVGPGYFSTLGVPMLLGREIRIQDTATSPKVCVINQAFAKEFFANRNPIGMHVTWIFGDTRTAMEVIGVAANSRDQQLRDNVPPRFFLPTDQAPAELQVFASLQVRAAGDPRQMLSTIRKTILSINSDIIVAEPRSLKEAIYNFSADERMLARLCTLFGILALLLAATGLYGVLSYGVNRRINEIGIRMALGAGRMRIVGMILRETGVLIAIGVAVGLSATAVVTRLIAARLYGLSALDPFTIGAAVCILGAVSMIAGYVPAARASRVNPVRALRHE
jgi:putative ABC transport system permease protein